MHPTIAALLAHLTPDAVTAGKVPPTHTTVVSLYADLATTIANNYSGPEATVALRKLLESRDAALRAPVGD